MKGQAYSIITILLVIPLLLFIVFYLSSSYQMRTGAMDRVVADQEHQVAKSIDDDFSRAAEISGRRAMLSSINEILFNGEFLGNGTGSMEELLNNGTLGGNVSVLMGGHTLPDWVSKIMAVQTGFDVYFNYSNLSVENRDGMSIYMHSDLTINISDRLNMSRIDRHFRRHFTVSAEEFEDPVFPLNTAGYVLRYIKLYPFPYHARKIVTGTGDGDSECYGNVSFDPGSPDGSKILVTDNASGISGFAGVVSQTSDAPSVGCYIAGASDAISSVNETVNSSGYLKLHIDNETQAVWSLPLIDYLDYYSLFPTGGPDFLNRLEGNLSETQNGMQTFVVEEPGVPDKGDQSRVDYLYFSNDTYNGNEVRHFPGWFRIDPANAARYNITELVEP